MRREYYSPALIEYCIANYNLGLGVPAIIDRLKTPPFSTSKIPHHSCIYKWLKAAGIKIRTKKGRPGKREDSKVEECISLFLKGKNNKEVKHIVGCSDYTINLAKSRITYVPQLKE